MTNEQILKKAIEKAVECGYDNKFKEAIDITINENKNSPTFEDELNGFSRVITFSHDFAKAFWGEEYCCNNCGWIIGDDDDLESCPKCGMFLMDDESSLSLVELSYKHHLQQMVLEEDPIKYLEKFI